VLLVRWKMRERIVLVLRGRESGTNNSRRLRGGRRLTILVPRVVRVSPLLLLVVLRRCCCLLESSSAAELRLVLLLRRPGRAPCAIVHDAVS